MKYVETFNAFQWNKKGDCPEWAKDAIEEYNDTILIRMDNLASMQRFGVGKWIIRQQDLTFRILSDEDFKRLYEPYNDQPATILQKGKAVPMVNHKTVLDKYRHALKQITNENSMVIARNIAKEALE